MVKPGINYLKLLGILGALSITPLSAAQANQQWYIGGGISAMRQFESNNVDYDAGHGFSGKVGIVPTDEGFFRNMRIEGEYLYQNNDIKSSQPNAGKTELDAGMLNGYYDFSNRTSIVPYIGVGVGYADVAVKSPGLGVSDSSDSGIALQVLTGASYTNEKNNHLRFYLAYRLFGIPYELDVHRDNGRIDDGYYVSHAVELGFHYKF